MLETIFRRAGQPARRVLSACGLALLAASATAAPAVRQLEIADYRAYLPEQHPVRQGMRAFADSAARASGGSLQVMVRSDALPGSPAAQIAALQAGAPGAPALMLVAGTGLAPHVKAFELLDLPYLVADAGQADALLDGPFGQALLARLAPAGLVGLAWWENGFRQITTAGAPVESARDLHGLDMRVIGEPVFVETARALGANPVALPFGELYGALKAKRVAAQDNFISQILAGRLYEVQASLSLTNHSYSALVLAANAQAWAALTPREQGILRRAALEAARVQRAAARAEAAAARDTLAARGMAVHTPAPAQSAMLRALTAPLRARYFSAHDPDLLKLYDAGTAQVR
jgi:tripartite ATP-independent transporter DctP family solute receptor